MCTRALPFLSTRWEPARPATELTSSQREAGPDFAGPGAPSALGCPALCVRRLSERRRPSRSTLFPDCRRSWWGASPVTSDRALPSCRYGNQRLSFRVPPDRRPAPLTRPVPSTPTGFRSFPASDPRSRWWSTSVSNRPPEPCTSAFSPVEPFCAPAVGRIQRPDSNGSLPPCEGRAPLATTCIHRYRVTPIPVADGFHAANPRFLGRPSPT